VEAEVRHVGNRIRFNEQHKKLSRQAGTSTAKNAKKKTKKNTHPAWLVFVLFVFLAFLAVLVLAWREMLSFPFTYVEHILSAMTEDAVAKEIVDAAYHIHAALGPGLFESVYEAILSSELEKRGLHVDRQHPIPVVYGGTRFEMGFRADLVVEDKVIVEIKSIADIVALHRKQLLTYLRLADKRLGLLINFNVVLIKDGITRIANGL
jgi:GxxExxY protein